MYSENLTVEEIMQNSPRFVHGNLTKISSLNRIPLSIPPLLASMHNFLLAMRGKKFSYLRIKSSERVGKKEENVKPKRREAKHMKSALVKWKSCSLNQQNIKSRRSCSKLQIRPEYLCSELIGKHLMAQLNNLLGALHIQRHNAFLFRVISAEEENLITAAWDRRGRHKTSILSSLDSSLSRS